MPNLFKRLASSFMGSSPTENAEVPLPIAEQSSQKPVKREGYDDKPNREPVFIKVVTTCLKTGAVSERVIDHNHPDQRQWLGRHCYWAFRSGHSITTIPV